MFRDVCWAYDYKEELDPCGISYKNLSGSSCFTTPEPSIASCGAWAGPIKINQARDGSNIAFEPSNTKGIPLISYLALGLVWDVLDVRSGTYLSELSVSD